MSEERGKRDGGTAGTSSPEDAGSATDATPGASSASAAPTGKKSPRRSAASASTAVAPARRTESQPAKSAARSGAQGTENIFKRLRRFFREVLAELRKVIWPNRKQLVTYTTVVVVFVTVMTALIFGLDLAFVKGVSWLFG
ncbi:preprotein translocase subunit SecE [Rhodococcus ruber]|uniref:preprotein translocase subunit SecE n=1 Tax=Rhodococcus ruber TaxID=1830 RepID=UPI00200D1679|nr:preprotein translocase subunit SecE [Rhodococcus ruber]UQB71659.1 preprotein translocase subunit SecE [Rhodococcus ruber]